ncbi:hypothetical protein ACFOWX_10115 [Sphingorhabdus arenilitoris]|uniref:Uncharacterized protein n=1 Tax=Sphingorhabdus arenilitoris TaxID=1490041 RepID=A0ABV8RHE5_9SPHN
MTATLRHISYDFGGCGEYCLAIGDQDAARRILIIPPLFDEMNRMRRVIVSAMRRLGNDDLQVFLPDLPGCNESQADLSNQDLSTWRRAMLSAAEQLAITHIASLRGGCLIDDGAQDLPHWRLSPAKGASLLKTMIRARIAGDKEAGIVTSAEQLLAAARGAPIELAGHRFGAAMLQSLEAAEARALPHLALCNLGGGGVTGSALWLRAEPQDDPQMAESLAQNLNLWSASCAG